MISLDNQTIEKWLESAEDFSYDFLRYSHMYLHAIGIDAGFIRARLIEAHSEWVEICSHWQTHLFEHDVESLSYTKIMSALLYCLTRRTFIDNIATYNNSGRRSDSEFDGSNEEREEAKQDFLGAPEAILSLDFCINILNFYEKHRTDRKENFTSRLTISMRHDLIYFLVNGDGLDALSVYMAIKALYTRN